MREPVDLQGLREAIEKIDREILDRLQERMSLVDQVAAAKVEAVYPFRDQAREEDILRRVRIVATELGLDPHQIERLYRLVMEMSIARQQNHVRSLGGAPLRVAYQGVEGSYSHLAAQRYYAGRDGGVLLTEHETVRQAIDSVLDGSADLALLPIENTTAGSINETYDVLGEGLVTVIGEAVAAIEHCLLALPGAKIEDLRMVISHPQGLLQCEEYLQGLKNVETRAEFDTAGSARKVRESGDRTVGAIASVTAARVYGLEVLAQGIQSQEGNFTRFVEVALEPVPCPPDLPCKTSLLLSLTHDPGVLGMVLQEFGRRGVNLTKLESRPVPSSPFQYRFYLDLEGHAASEAVVDALKAIAPLTTELRVLGTYPQASPTESE